MEMTGYTKLFGSIVASTVWREPHTVRIVWITMLAMANKYGVVEASLPGLADLARVTIDECVEALDALSSPDEYSRTPDFEGRRIEKAEGGWKILNHGKYREKMGVDERREYLKMKQRESRNRRKSEEPSTSVNRSSETSTPSTHADAQSDADAEASISKGVCEGKNSRLLPTTPQSKRIATLFNRKLTTAWSEREVAAYKKLGTIPEEDLAAIERYYASERAKGDEGVHRRDLGTFLNNFAGELDRAKAATISKNGKSTADAEPEGWREWCASKGYPVGEFRYAKDWIKSEFRRAGK